MDVHKETVVVTIRGKGIKTITKSYSAYTRSLIKLKEWLVQSGSGNEVWIYSGCLVLDTKYLEKVGSNSSIVVPDQFYKVVIMNNGNEFPEVLVFLFPHFADKSDIHEKSIFSYLVSIDYLESVSGLNFFNTYSDNLQSKYENFVNIAEWEDFID